MRSIRAEHIILAVLLVVPLAIAFIGWPLFARWAVGPAPQPTPEAAGAEATSAAFAAHNSVPSRPTVGAPQTVVPRAVATQPAPVTTPTEVAAATARTPAATATPAQQPTATIVQQPAQAGAASGPEAAVQEFYAHVAQHDFAAAAVLWSPQMRAQYPPPQNIDARFSQTRSVTVNRAQVISQDPSGSRATVAVDLTESAADGQRHWSGSWQVVHGPSGWLLDQPALQPS